MNIARLFPIFINVLIVYGVIESIINRNKNNKKKSVHLEKFLKNKDKKQVEKIKSTTNKKQKLSYGSEKYKAPRSKVNSYINKEDFKNNDMVYENNEEVDKKSYTINDGVYSYVVNKNEDEFIFDARKAVIYSEILQKPVCLR